MKNRKNKDTNRAADIEIRSEKLLGMPYHEKAEGNRGGVCATRLSFFRRAAGGRRRNT